MSILVGILLSLETMVCAVFKAATQAWARIMEILGCPIVRIPLLSNEIQINASNTFGISSAAGAVDKMSRVTPNNFRSCIPVLLLGFAPFYHLPIKVTECDLPF